MMYNKFINVMKQGINNAIWKLIIGYMYIFSKYFWRHTMEILNVFPFIPLMVIRFAPISNCTRSDFEQLRGFFPSIINFAID